MKPMFLALAILMFPMSLNAMGTIAYSGIPCKWSCEHEVIDKVGLVEDDPDVAKEDRRLMDSCGTREWYVERADGRMLLTGQEKEMEP